MKMRLTGFLAFALLSFSILSYGVSGAAFAASDPNPALPVSTDVDIVSNGGSVEISGTLPNYDSSSGKGLTFLVLSPDNSIVQVGQLTLGSDGSFAKSFVVGGPLWKSTGDYTIKLTYGVNNSEVTVNYVGGEAEKKEDPPIKVPPEDPPEIKPPPPAEDPPEITPPPPPPPPAEDPPKDDSDICGLGTVLGDDGLCYPEVTDEPQSSSSSSGGGCLIATAAYGTELAPQVQFLREIRDNTVMSTSSGTSFMSGFNQLYYSFSPTIADMERENPMFQQAVRAFITPMISTLSIMTLADAGSEAEVLGFGISVIALNLGMYIAAPALIGFKVSRIIIKSRN